ncbi:F-box protein CPR30-like protein [Corchorus olitorius]|uniref:F-box protein CPR30-like protein n=1 Tax=Corchorus olitorius TaxID=93759 RepID=A0A1R3K0P0_9ROSI|nr:F-box protein CPR30-like protein [Corchorus olitorius]
MAGFDLAHDTVRYEIEYFDFDKDEFKVIPQPDHLMEGRLCISNYSPGNGSFQIWVMEEYAVNESWSVTYFNDIISGKPVWFAKTINVSLVREGVKRGKDRCLDIYHIYNDKEKGSELKFLAGKGIIDNAFVFVESLISLETEKVEEVEVV